MFVLEFRIFLLLTSFRWFFYFIVGSKIQGKADNDITYVCYFFLMNVFLVTLPVPEENSNMCLTQIFFGPGDGFRRIILYLTRS